MTQYFEPNNSNILYNKRIPVSIRRQHGSMLEERVNSINVRIVDRSGPLEVMLVDETDPMFLYKTLISEREFSIIKSQQSLFVDFHQFPGKFMEMLDGCQGNGFYPDYQQYSSPKFTAQLVVGNPETVFNLLEANSFRAVTLLSLRMDPPTEESLRYHLFDMINMHKNESVRLRSELNNQQNSQARLREAEQVINNLRSELDATRAKTATYQHNWDMRGRNTTLEATLNSLQGQLDSTRRELTQALDTLRQVEYERDIYHDSLVDLEGQEKVRDLQRRNGLGPTARSKSQPPSSPVVAKLEDNVKRLTDEINKGNDIIRRLQTELRSAKSKLKLKNVVTLQQEKLLEERLQTIETLQRELIAVREDKRNVKETYVDFERKLQEREEWLKNLPPLPHEGRPKDHVFRSKYVPDSVFD